jgi:quercetin dioxygenase-like cupin family protein
MTTKSPYVIHPYDQPFYSPAHHTGTRNYRLVGPPTNGSKYLEIALGDIERHEGSPAHAHPDLEQAVYIIEGEATVTIDGIVEEVKTGDLLFFPPHVFHDIKVKSERIKLLVIYSPPFLEAPVMHLATATDEGK